MANVVHVRYEPSLIDRMRSIARDHEKYEQGGGASEILNEAADALERAIGMLESLEFSVDTSAATGKDTRGCPCCGGSSIVGLAGEHIRGCKLVELLHYIS